MYMYFRSNRNKHNDDDELILIPDLDEDGLDEDKRVAHAPKNVTRKIPTLTELNNEVKTVISSNDLGYDFGVLLNALVPLEFLSEPDVQWTFDNLLQVHGYIHRLFVCAYFGHRK